LLNTSDKLILEFLKVGTNNIGKYNVAYTFGNYFNNLGTAAGFAIVPLLNECYKKGEDLKARNLIFILQVVFFGLTFVISIWMKELFEFFIRGEGLSSMFYLSVIIVMSYNYRPMYFGCNAKIIFSERTKILWRVSFIAGILNVILNLVFVSLFGFEAAAYTTFASLMYMGYAGFFLNEFKRDNPVNYYPVYWLGATIVLTAAAYTLVFMPVWIKLLVTALLIPVIAYALLRTRKMLYESKGSR
jgi:O-antigen/teichoic acid export membrane protein